MYHIVKDVASLKTTSSQKDRFPKGLHISKLRASPIDHFKSLRDIVNIAKIHRQYLRDARGCRSDKKKGIFLSVDLFKEKTNQHRTLHLAPQQAGFIVNRNRISVMVVLNCMNIPKYTLIGYIYLSNGGWGKII